MTRRQSDKESSTVKVKAGVVVHFPPGRISYLNAPVVDLQHDFQAGPLLSLLIYIFYSFM